jgi:hypothetical protein
LKFSLFPLISMGKLCLASLANWSDISKIKRGQKS